MVNKIKFNVVFILAFIVLSFFIPAVSLADNLGDQSTFNTDIQYDKFGRSSVTATLRTVSDHAYFYIEDKYWDSLNFYEQGVINNDIKKLANEFETVIYPKEREFWGSEPNPGVDNDPRITILLEDLAKNYGGYFETVNLVSKERSPDSNERELFVISVQALGNDALKGFLAHEFQHLISYNQKEIINQSTEDVWLNELRSEYSVGLLGYNNYYTNSNLERRVGVFVANPSDSLTEWPNISLDYSMVTIFGEYLADRFGPSILNETLHHYSYGIPSFNQYLNPRGTNFGEVFMDWMAATYLNDQSVDPKYGYSKLDLKSAIKIRPQTSSAILESFGYNGSINIKDWQPYWIEYDLQGVSDTSSLKLDVSGSGQILLASYIAFYKDGTIEVKKIPVISGRALGFVPNSSEKKLNKVAVMVTKANKIIDFGKDEPSAQIYLNANMVDNSIVRAQTLKDGDLIKRPGEKEIYVIWGKYKRYLHPEVIKLYGHLDPSKAVEVEPEIFNSYTTANYVRNVNEQKVYAVWPDGTKHWMNITAQQWDATGRDWNAIFIINDLELNYYKIGADITR